MFGFGKFGKKTYAMMSVIEREVRNRDHRRTLPKSDPL